MAGSKIPHSASRLPDIRVARVARYVHEKSRKKNYCKSTLITAACGLIMQPCYVAQGPAMPGCQINEPELQRSCVPSGRHSSPICKVEAEVVV